MELITSLIVPVMVFLILMAGVLKGVKCFEVFKKGAEEGVKTILGLLPTFIGLITAIGVFRASGAIDYVVGAFKPFFAIGDFTEELFPLVLMRPVSGSASLAVLEGIIKNNGPDSFTAVSAAVMMGSTETIIYTMSVYTGNKNIKSMPGVLPAAIIANVISALGAILICKLFFL